ncbi:MAG: (Fe-S)-binding protein, partial [Myxococcales bacterium]|nr:(Fe-S)-binding protein [Myxococcales bacterium]
MLTMLLGLFAAFCWSANRRWQLLKVGRPIDRLDDLGERLKGTYVYAFMQKKMDYYRGAGLAHKAIFVGFMILLLNTLILWGRGFDPSFDLWILGPEGVELPVLGVVQLGHFYDFIKETVATLVLLGAVFFLYLRVGKQEARMTHSGEAVLILFIIIVMMIGDFAYVGASQVLYTKYWTSVCAGGELELCESVGTVAMHLGPMPEAAGTVSWGLYPTPMGSLFAVLMQGAGVQQLVTLAHLGFWAHATLVMVFLNLLPHSKHFHVITAIPNVFTRNLEPPGKLAFAGTSEAIGETVMAAYEAMEAGTTLDKPFGVSRIEDFSWKAILDFYTCTECGRCSDHCPAHRTGKILSPKQFTIDLRDHLYSRETEFLDRKGGPQGAVEDAHHAHDGHGDGDHGHDDHGDHGHDDHGHDDHGHDDHGHDDHHHAPMPDNPAPNPDIESAPIDLVGNVIHADVLWACTTCRACEEQCPVMISYVDKIVDMRRNLVMLRGEFPAELQKTFSALETNGNPWNITRMDRAAWTDGLDVPLMSDKPDAEVLYWVGCAA